MKKRHRLTVDITPDQQEFLDHFSYGQRKQIFSTLIDMLRTLTNKHGLKSLSQITNHQIDFEKFLER